MACLATAAEDNSGEGRQVMFDIRIAIAELSAADTHVGHFDLEPLIRRYPELENLLRELQEYRRREYTGEIEYVQ